MHESPDPKTGMVYVRFREERILSKYRPKDLLATQSGHRRTYNLRVTASQKFPWKRLSVEAAVIVGSILLAFAIDAGWEERRERQAEIMLFERLRADFIDIQIALELVDEEHLKSRDSCITLLNFAVGDALPATAEVDNMVAYVFLVSRTFNPGSGAVASFLSSEGAQLVRNQPLADLLLTWSGLVEELQEEEANLQKSVSEQWTPYLASRANLGPYIASFGDLMAGIPSHVSTPTPRKPLVVDEIFVNHVLDRFKWQQLALRDIEPLHVAVEEILFLLEAELSI